MIDRQEKLSIVHRKTTGEERMDTGRGQIDLFLRKCDELMQSGFILADTKIAELLKSIASSDLLYALFRELTKDFDYAAARRACMGGEEEAQGGAFRLPEDPEKKLAFIFCLLVDLDSKALDLGGFIRSRFPAGGSVHEGFYIFCAQVVMPFKEAVRALFCTASFEGGEAEALAKCAAGERDRIYFSRMPDTKKVDALLLLNALSAACADKSGERAAALLCGYLCFARCEGLSDGNIDEMRRAFARIKEGL